MYEGDKRSPRQLSQEGESVLKGGEKDIFHRREVKPDLTFCEHELRNN